MTTIVKKKLSASTDGKLIKVAATATAGTLIHTSRSDTGAGQWKVGIIAVADGSFATIPNTEDCTAVHVIPKAA